MEVQELILKILKRPRHNKIVNSLKSLGVKINFISDGDVSGVISVAYPKKNIDMYLTFIKLYQLILFY